MNIIQNRSKELNIISSFLDNDCKLSFLSFVNIINNIFTDPIVMYYNDYKKIIRLRNDVISQKFIKQDDLTIIKFEITNNNYFRIKFIDFENKKEPLYLTSGGIIHDHGVESLLFDLQKYFIGTTLDRNKISNQLEWILFMNKLNAHIYGGWLYRFFSDCKLDRDIDIYTYYTETLSSLFNKQQLLYPNKVTIENKLNTKKSNYVDSLKVKFNLITIKNKPVDVVNKFIDHKDHDGIIVLKKQYIGINFLAIDDDTTIQFDIHKYNKKTNIDCDAFTNILMLKGDYMSTSYIPKELSLLTTLILAFNDIKNKNYTLIKKLPTSDYHKKLRLIVKPYERMQNNVKINYDYLKYIDVKYQPIETIIKQKQCGIRHDNDTTANNIPKFVVHSAVDNGYICTHCIYKKYYTKN